MGSKNKLKRFRQNLEFPNVIQPSRETVTSGVFEHKGKWQTYFNNTNPIVLELGCGKGEYSVFLAEKYPEKNFIGIDIKGARFWAGAKDALAKKLSNVAFLRTQIELLDCIFNAGEVSEIWITFPDPQIKFKRTKHRLTNPSFLKMYKKLLQQQGCMHLKTDSEYLHGYTLGLLEGMGIAPLYAHHDIYGNPYAPKEATAIQTHYEQLFLEKGKAITYLKFQF